MKYLIATCTCDKNGFFQEAHLTYIIETFAVFSMFGSFQMPPDYTAKGNFPFACWPAFCLLRVTADAQSDSTFIVKQDYKGNWKQETVDKIPLWFSNNLCLNNKTGF